MNWKVRFNDYQSQFRKIESQMIGTIHRVLSRGDIVDGDQQSALETSLAQLCGTDHAFGINNCTNAFTLALQSCGVEPGDGVITTARCHPAVMLAIVECEARPVLVDVQEDLLMSADELTRVISDPCKAVVPSHTNGRCADIPAICAVARQHNCVVIEDATSAVGATLAGRHAGSCGDVGVFDVGPTSLVSGLGEGAALVTSAPDIARRLDGLYRADSRGGRKCLNNLLAAVVDLKLKHLPDDIRRRQELAQLYHRGLRRVAGVVAPPEVDSTDRCDVFHRFEIQSPFRNDLSEFLTSRGIQHELPQPLGRMVNTDADDRPVSRHLQRTGLYLPMHSELTTDNVEFVAQSVAQFHQSNKDRQAA